MNVIEKMLNEKVTIENDTFKIYPFILEPKVIIDLFEIYSDFENTLGYSKQYEDIMEFAGVMRDKVNYHQNEIFGYISFLIELKENNKIIGLRNVFIDGAYTFNGIRKDNNENMITEMVINKKFWNKGYGKRASTLIFETLAKYNVKNIITTIHTGNTKGLGLDNSLNFNEIEYSDLLENFKYNPGFKLLTVNFDNSIILLKQLN